MSSNFHPFADNAQSFELAGITFENQGDQVNIFGQITLTPTKESLANALELQEIINSAVDWLKNQPTLKNNAELQYEVDENVSTIPNPFNPH